MLVNANRNNKAFALICSNKLCLFYKILMLYTQFRKNIFKHFHMIVPSKSNCSLALYI